jgi:tetratricopeptide (TPR) repeat protein
MFHKALNVNRYFWLAVAAIWLACGLRPGLAAQLDLPRVHFAPAINPAGKQASLPTWTPWRKKQVLATLARLYKKAPGLIGHAALYRPITFVPGRGRRVAARALIKRHVIELTPWFFRAGQTSRLELLAHELTHLADSGFVLSASRGFIGLIEPRLTAARQELDRRRLTWYQALRGRVVSPLRRLGLPNAYAASAPYEALAELAGRALSGRFRPPPEIAGFLAGLARWPVRKSPALALWHDAQALRVAGAPVDEIIEMLSVAIWLDPDFGQARLLRAQLRLEAGRGDQARRDLIHMVFKARAEFQAAQARAMLAILAAHLGKPANALRHANDAIARDPAMWRFYLLRARLLLAAGKPKPAWADIRKARRFGRHHLTSRDRSFVRRVLLAVRGTRTRRIRRSRRRPPGRGKPRPSGG